MKTIEVPDDVYSELERWAQQCDETVADAVAGGAGLSMIFLTALANGLSLVVVNGEGQVMFDVTAEYKKSEAEFHAKMKAGENTLKSVPNQVDSAPFA